MSPKRSRNEAGGGQGGGDGGASRDTAPRARKRRSEKPRKGGKVLADTEQMFGFDRLAADPTVGHVPVLVGEILTLLRPQPGQTCVDLTVGRGGHALAFASAVGREGTVIGVDLDEENLRFAESRVAAAGSCRFVGVHGPFSDAPRRIAELGLRADVVLGDLGFASTQIDDPQRGLSFSSDGPLDMRFDRSSGQTAADLLAVLPERELLEMLRHLGEEPLAPKIARQIVRLRDAERSPQTTDELVAIVEEVYGPRARHSRLHPATRTFMALRIAVNDELNHIAALLQAIADQADVPTGDIDTSSTGDPRPADWLRPDARIGIVSFHSLEDRLVKHAFASFERKEIGTRITTKPVIASDAEVAANPRSRSAKLRTFQIGATRRNRREKRRLDE